MTKTTTHNTGIGGNGGWTSRFQLKNKARQRSGVDLILHKNPVNSSFKILKAFAAGQTNKASLPLRQCLNVGCHKMKSLKVISVLLIFASCKINHQTQVPDKVLIETGFYPSFHLPVEIKLQKDSDSGYLTCKVIDYDSANKVIAFDSVLLAKNDFDTFFKMLDTVSLLKIPYDTSDLGMDGITVIANIIRNGQTNRFRTWSPSRYEKPIHYKFLDAILDLLNRKLPKLENYIEDVQGYLSYGLGIKIKSENPIVIKMYGGYSIDDATGLQSFFDSLPRNKPVIMDMSNFDGMGTILHDYFAVCDETHEKMIWVTPGKLKEYFTEVGIDTNKMASSVEIAKRMAAQ